jgi:hypothetical protein
MARETTWRPAAAFRRYLAARDQAGWFRDRLRYRRRDAGVIVVAFDLIELNGEGVRRERRRKLGR